MNILKCNNFDKQYDFQPRSPLKSSFQADLLPSQIPPAPPLKTLTIRDLFSDAGLSSQSNSTVATSAKK